MFKSLKDWADAFDRAHSDEPQEEEIELPKMPEPEPESDDIGGLDFSDISD